MKTKEIREAIHVKNALLQQQARRIELLEEKMTELRKKYFQLIFSNSPMQGVSGG